VPLFIDRLPFVWWTDNTRTPPQTQWWVVLPDVVTDLGVGTPPLSAPLQYWAVDSAHRGAAFAWRRHLIDAGLDPDVLRLANMASITTALGGETLVPVRLAALLLVSNVHSLQGATWRIEIDPGLPFNNVTTLPNPNFNRPLIGLRALRRARLRVEVDCDTDTVSVWTPDPPVIPAVAAQP
jgi:hypothetical protein